MGKATLGSAPSHVKQHSQRRAGSAKPASTAPSPVVNMSAQPRTSKTSTLLRASHTPRAIRLACTPGSSRKQKLRPAPQRAAPAVDEPSTSMALGPYMVGPLALPEQHLPHTIYMDASGHMHEKLEDGGFLYMDVAGNCHLSLNDGGMLYMDRQGSCHKSLFDQPQRVVKKNEPAVPSQNLGSRSPRHTAPNTMMLLTDAELNKLERSTKKAHSEELHMLQAKPMADLRHMQRRASMPNKSTRRMHHIAQPRKMN